MDFRSALVQLNNGSKVTRDGVTLVREDGVISDDETGDVFTVSLADIDSIDWTVVEEVRTLTANEVYCVFDTAKNRWVSTVNPQQHMSRGNRVAVFVRS